MSWTWGGSDGGAANVGSAGLGFLSGLFPDPTNTTSSGSASGTQNTNATSNSDMASLFNQLQQMLSSQRQTQQQTQTQTLDPAGTAFMNGLIQRFGGQSQPISASNILAQNTQGINAASDAQKAGLNADLASRGLSTSPVAGSVMANADNNRINQISQASQAAPLAANQLNLQNLMASIPLLSSLPKTTTIGGTTDVTGTQTNKTGGGSTQTVGTGTNTNTNFNQNQNSSSNTNSGGGLGSAFSGAASGVLGILGMLSDRRLKKNIKTIGSLPGGLKLKTWQWKHSHMPGVGVIAQDLEKDKNTSHLVHHDPATGFKSVNYAGLVPHLLSAMNRPAQVTKS